MCDLKFAIQMELDGEDYYRKQAELNKDNSLYTVCMLLAIEEKEHSEILLNKLNDKSYQLVDTNTLENAKNIFANIGNVKTEAKKIASQLDFYRLASKNEVASIKLYEKYLNESQEKKEKELFLFLISQEKQHLAILEELAKLISRAEEWTESAEFGIREDY
ncbi:MAG: ferritin family protein [Bacilli bacterium]|nr:ferritin family protein [Bacilli bacterium]